MITCDICGKEVSPASAFSNFIGVTIRMDQNIELKKMQFEGYYCGDCTTEIMKAVDNIKNAKNSSTI